MIRTIAHKLTIPGITLENPVKKALNWLVAADAAYRDRAKLATMSDSQLSDIGLSRSEARRLSGKTGWDVPSQFY